MHEQEILYTTHEVPLGKLLIAGSERGILRIRISDVGHSFAPDGGWRRDEQFFDEAREQLDAYFHRELRDFTLPLDLSGTPFQVRCWNALCDIPFGETRTYASLARQVDSPGASRAVGQALHRNPVSIVVPCHRVRGSDGSLTGFLNGVEAKQYLLDLESGLTTAR